MKKLLICIIAIMMFALVGCEDYKTPDLGDLPDNCIQVGYGYANYGQWSPICIIETTNLAEETATLEIAYDLILAKYQNGTLGTEFVDEVEMMIDGYDDYAETAVNENNERFMVAYVKLQLLIGYMEEEGH